MYTYFKYLLKKKAIVIPQGDNANPGATICRSKLYSKTTFTYSMRTPNTCKHVHAHTHTPILPIADQVVRSVTEIIW